MRPVRARRSRSRRAARDTGTRPSSRRGCQGASGAQPAAYLHLLQRAASLPRGHILCCGPRASGRGFVRARDTMETWQLVAIAMVVLLGAFGFVVNSDSKPAARTRRGQIKLTQIKYMKKRDTTKYKGVGAGGGARRGRTSARDRGRAGVPRAHSALTARFGDALAADGAPRCVPARPAAMAISFAPPRACLGYAWCPRAPPTRVDVRLRLGRGRPRRAGGGGARPETPCRASPRSPKSKPITVLAHSIPLVVSTKQFL